MIFPCGTKEMGNKNGNSTNNSPHDYVINTDYLKESMKNLNINIGHKQQEHGSKNVVASLRKCLI